VGQLGCGGERGQNDEVCGGQGGCGLEEEEEEEEEGGWKEQLSGGESGGEEVVEWVGWWVVCGEWWSGEVV